MTTAKLPHVIAIGMIVLVTATIAAPIAFTNVNETVSVPYEDKEYVAEPYTGVNSHGTAIYGEGLRTAALESSSNGSAKIVGWNPIPESEGAAKSTCYPTIIPTSEGAAKVTYNPIIPTSEGAAKVTCSHPDIVPTSAGAAK